MRVRTRALAGSLAVSLTVAAGAVVPATVRADVGRDCGAAPPAGEATARPYADNDVWVGDDGVHYAAPGGATPRRAVSVHPDGSAGVTLERPPVGGGAVGAGPDGACQEHEVLPSDEAAGCDKPVGGPVTARPNNAEQVDYDWNAGYRRLPVSFTSARTCATLAGDLYGPPDLDEHGPLPSVLVLPPSGGVATKEQVAYVARTLAGQGYVALSVDPQGVGGSDLVAWPPCGTEPGYSHPSPCEGVPFQRMDNWMEAGRTGLDFLLGPDNPWAAHVDATRVGATGHSLGARTASYLQDPAYDRGPGTAPRVHAVVGLDNLSSNYFGDSSASSNGGTTNNLVNGQPLGGDGPIAVTAPGLGLASDEEGGDPDEKKAASDHFRAGGQWSGMLVFEGVAHGEFGQQASSVEADLKRFAHYTLAWFDRWLRDDPTALDRLLVRELDGVPVETYLSDTKRSGWFLPGLTDCEDWRAGCG